jgi:hypothetical protein
MTNQILLTEDLAEVISPPLTRKMANLAQKVSFTKSLIALPLVYKGTRLGLVNFGSTYIDNLEAERGILVAIGQEISKSLYRLLDQNETQRLDQ